MQPNCMPNLPCKGNVKRADLCSEKKKENKYVLLNEKQFQLRFGEENV